MRQRTRLKLAAAGLGVLILVLLVAVGITVKRRLDYKNSLLQGLEAQTTATQEQPVPVDPFAGLETQAAQRVHARTVTLTDGRTLTLAARAGERFLETNIALFDELSLAAPEWVARRIESTSVYEVLLRFTWNGLAFGPRWLVQMDPEGMRPEGSDGLLATNALARVLETPDATAQWRYFNRSDEVLTALTEHRFESGLRLASSLVVYFANRETSESRVEVLGWAVIPESIDPNGELVYRAYFVWREGDRIEDAVWQVSYQGGVPSFRPRDRRAEEIMGVAAGTDPETLIDIRPMTMRDDVPPAQESEPCRRALRHLLADVRIVESVGAVLAIRAQNVALEYRNWNVNAVPDAPSRCTVEYLYNEASEARSVAWQVDHTNGDRYAVSDVARIAEQTVRMRPLELPAPAATP
jgi:hypothetical protein